MKPEERIKVIIGDAGAIICMIGIASFVVALLSGIFWHSMPIIAWISIILITLGFIFINVEQSDNIKYLSRNYRDKSDE